MDDHVVGRLQKAGIETALKERVPAIAVLLDEEGRPKPVGDEVTIFSGKIEERCQVHLKAIPELFAGAAEPPDFADGPAPGYEMFFCLIERTAADFCVSTGRMELDDEFRRLYRLLAERPGGDDRNPLFTYIQAAARLYMSLRDVSRAELEAVALRLSRFARNVTAGPTSTNYVESARRLLLA